MEDATNLPLRPHFLSFSTKQLRIMDGIVSYPRLARMHSVIISNISVFVLKIRRTLWPHIRTLLPSTECSNPERYYQWHNLKPDKPRYWKRANGSIKPVSSIRNICKNKSLSTNCIRQCHSTCE